jgi:beta-N-acetylhexosaminidase
MLFFFTSLFGSENRKVLNLQEFKQKSTIKQTKENLLENEIKKMIGNMLLVGFYGETVNAQSKIIKQINKYHLAGVILFDKDPTNKKKIKNIRNPKQLQKLTKQLQQFTNHPILIAIDQEGGLVSRLKKSNGFINTPSAKKIGKKNNISFTRTTYKKLADELASNGINCNFAPVVDVAINSKNNVIVNNDRSFAKDPKTVIKHAKIFIEELKKNGIISVLKHFPGHGSSFKDSHNGFVDISKTWKDIELKPYLKLIANKNVDMIMTAHVFNRHLDKKYPATLSYKINTQLLRNKIGFDGVIISDDLQMKAISQNFSLDQILNLTINSGIDILLFANQVDHPIDIDQIVNKIYNLTQKNIIPLKNIVNANCRINKLINSYSQKIKRY